MNFNHRYFVLRGNPLLKKGVLMFIRYILISTFALIISTSVFATGDSAMKTSKSDTLLVNFDDQQSLANWLVTNDGVMGGLSQGNVEIIDSTLIFSGKVSIENNGGFTSINKVIPTLPEAIKYIAIHILGDGNPYQLRLRSRVQGYNVAYKVDFLTQANIKQTLTFKLAEFKASFRGRIIKDAPILTADTVSHVGFLIATKQSKDFNLSIDAIEFY